MFAAIHGMTDVVCTGIGVVAIHAVARTLTFHARIVFCARIAILTDTCVGQVHTSRSGLTGVVCAGVVITAGDRVTRADPVRTHIGGCAFVAVVAGLGQGGELAT